MGLVYNIYNAVFSDNIKKVMRNKLKKIYKWYEPRYKYNYYVSEFKRYAKIAFINPKSWNKKDEYIDKVSFTVNEFMQDTRSKVLQNKICHMDKCMIPDDMSESIKNIKEKGIDYFCHNITLSDVVKKDDIIFDTQRKMYYGIYHGKNLYFKAKSYYEAYENLSFLLYEQAKQSPHRYLTDSYTVEEGDVVFDVGCADGNFTLDIIDKASKCYLFETMDEWQKPLENTFSSYGNKVEIIHKYVSDCTENESISIDDFCERNDIDHIDMLKADIEGAEELLLSGAARMISKGKIRKICICTYHTIDAEQNISKMLNNYEKEMSDGYMIYSAWVGPIEEMREPYLVKGVMRARLKDGCI